MNDNEDPVVGFRAPYNRLSLNRRQSGLNAEGIRIVRMLYSGIKVNRSLSDQIKITILDAYLHQDTYNDEESSGLWSINNDSEDEELS